jgi:DNA topoisomerase-1
MPRISKKQITPELEKPKEEKVKKSKTSKTPKLSKSSGNILIITEKPQAADKIAAALSNGKDKKVSEKGVSYYTFEKNGKKIFVGCAVGHLFGLQQKEKGTVVPNFEIEWQPNFKSKGASYTKKYYDTLKKISKNIEEIIVATDYDNEGEVIGWNVVRFICDKQDAKRMKFSSLTKDELINAYENPSPTINWGQAIAGETRHYLDWFYGINLSRQLMKSISKAGSFKILSIGRVQGPCLKIIIDKEKEIQNFKPEPYWQVFIKIVDSKKQFLELIYPKNLTKESELLKFQQLKGKKAIARTEIKQEELPSPTPFDLTTLQTEAYKYCGLTPSQTLKIAQQLYLDGLISYPRTSSQEYPESIGYEKILKDLGKQTPLTKYALNKTPTKGKKKDPAHPAIYPTGESKQLVGQDKKLYELIMKRFISCFCLPALIENKKVIVEINDLKFEAKGMQIKQKNWMNVYPTKLKESELPTIEGEVNILEIRTEEKMTKPPNRYTAASIVKELEKRNLGTKSTRANILETLYDRGYIKERSIIATALGISLVESLEKHSPIILDDVLTEKMEEELNEIQNSDKKSELDTKQTHLIEEAKQAITKISKDMISHQDEIGKELAIATKEVREQEKQDNTLTKCPNCNTGDLRISYNRASRRFFISCNAYPNCKTTFSLPPNSLIKPSKDNEGQIELCPDCKFPMLLALRQGRRPWKFCFNPVCPSKQKIDEQTREQLKEKLKETTSL